jgi:hypothetical protein
MGRPSLALRNGWGYRTSWAQWCAHERLVTWQSVGGADPSTAASAQNATEGLLGDARPTTVSEPAHGSQAEHTPRRR